MAEPGVFYIGLRPDPLSICNPANPRLRSRPESVFGIMARRLFCVPEFYSYRPWRRSPAFSFIILDNVH
jgi:hypothetical protein